MLRLTHYTLQSQFIEAVDRGLSVTPKSLPSWLLYDKYGDKIFQQIMDMPEYYLTRCEIEILERYKIHLREYFYKNNEPFQLVELGAGNGVKTEILIRHLMARQTDFAYVPVDVSVTVLQQLERRLRNTMPALQIHPVHGHNDEVLENLKNTEGKKVLLFLGSSIGNYTTAEAATFLQKVKVCMNMNDLLLVGFDLQKDPRIIQAAYDDPHGITREFNLNLLRRLNRELGADFNVEHFSHYPYYDPEFGVASSYLISQKEQSIYFTTLVKAFNFDQWEPLHTEISLKYDLLAIENLATASGLVIDDIFYDSRNYFCDVLMKVKA